MTVPIDKKTEKTVQQESDKKDPTVKSCSPKPCWLILLLGFVAGSMGGLLGVGGGIIMIPFMTQWGVTQKRAQGTSLVVIAAIAPLTIIMYAWLGNIDFRFAVPLAIGGLIGGEIGSRLAMRFSNRVIGQGFSILLILVALKMLFYHLPEHSVGNVLSSLEMVEAGALGIGAGLAAGFFGVGGGIVYVPIGVVLGGLTQVVAQGSSWTAIFPTVLLCGNRYRIQKEVDWDLSKWLILGALLGVIAGAKWADMIPSRQLQYIFAVYLMYTGISRLVRSFRDRLRN